MIEAAQARQIMLVGPDGSSLEACALAFTGTGVSAVDKKRRVELKPLAFDLGAIASEIEATPPRVREWLFKRIDAAIERGVRAGTGVAPFGGLVLEWRSPELLQARWRSPLSVPCLEYFAGDELQLFEKQEPQSRYRGPHRHDSAPARPGPRDGVSCLFRQVVALVVHPVPGQLPTHRQEGPGPHLHLSRSRLHLQLRVVLEEASRSVERRLRRLDLRPRCSNCVAPRARRWPQAAGRSHLNLDGLQ